MVPTVPPFVIGCSNLVVTEQGYLLVQESKASARARYNFPAGKPELGETLAEAAVREAREEAGIDVTPEYLVGIYQCPRTSEGVGVVNFVFRSAPTGGAVRTSEEHPEVRYFTREEVAGLGRQGRLRGIHIELAIDQCAAGARLPLDTVQVVPSSTLPA